MVPSRMFTRVLRALSGVLPLVMMASAAMAADPGIPYPATSPLSDQHPGSLLIFNLYTSNSAMPNLQNTRFTISNTSTTSSSIVHLFFIEGATCSPADRYMCLTPNQTVSFLASDQSPNETGFMIAIAVAAVTGCPTSHNFLVGSEFIKTETGHQAALQAEGFSALYQGAAPGCTGLSPSVTLLFNGDTSGTQPSYDRLPRVIAASKNYPAVADGNDTRIVLNRIGGSLFTTMTPIGSLIGIVYDELEALHSFTFSTSACQIFQKIDNNFPHTSPPIESASMISAGRTGWLKVWTAPPVDGGLVGSIINRNVNLTSASNAFVGGHNLHKLTLSPTNSLLVPIFPPSCF